MVIERSDVGFCVDTGHLALAGVDIASMVERARGRIHHIHLKDVDMEAAERVRSGRVGFRQAVIDGMFKPLGHGGVDIAGTIEALEKQEFTGWYVLEQDLALGGDPPHGQGPIENAKQSMTFLQDLALEMGSTQETAAT